VVKKITEKKDKEIAVCEKKITVGKEVAKVLAKAVKKKVDE